MQDCQAGVWVCDCSKTQLNAPTRVCQLCLSPQIRNLRGVIDPRPGWRWVRDKQALFRTAIHLGKRREPLTRQGFVSQRTLVAEPPDKPLKRPFRGIGTNLLQRHRTYRQPLLVFLYRSDVPAHYNACEHAWCPSVIHRKVMGSFRPECGVQTDAALETVLKTAKRKGENPSQTLVALMGQPVSPFVQQSFWRGQWLIFNI